MLDFGPDIIRAMNLIEDAQEAGHLLSPDKFIAQHETELELIHQSINGRTTHPCFKQLNEHTITYRLKANVSASNAIRDLLSSHETFIECGVAINICYYLVILSQMERLYGSIEGSKRFDYLFGEEHNTTSESLRLLLSPSPFINGTRALPGTKNPLIDPLSFLAGYLIVPSKGSLSERAEIGDLLIFNGDPAYMKIHPLGSNSAHNCIITSLSPLKVRTFALGKEELSEHDLYENHITAYSMPPSQASISKLGDKFIGSQEFQALRETPTDKSKIPGFVNMLIKINTTKFHFLLHDEIDTVKRALLEHQSNALGTTQNLNFQAFTSQATEQKKPSSNSRQQQTTSSTFAGLDGLKGAFNKSESAQPIALNLPNSTVSHCNLPPITRLNTTKESNYLGFSAGFLNTASKQQAKETPHWATGIFLSQEEKEEKIKAAHHKKAGK